MARSILLLTVGWLLLLSATAMAGATGVGVFGGTLYPIAQQDQSAGYTYGLRARLNLTGPLVLEPNLTLGSFGNTEFAGVGERKGSSLKHYGVDLILGNRPGSVGPKPFLFIGGGIYNSKRDGDLTTNKSGWSFGGGLAYGIKEIIEVDLRGRINIVASEGSASKKSGTVMLGVTYYFGELGED